MARGHIKSLSSICSIKYRSGIEFSSIKEKILIDLQLSCFNYGCIFKKPIIVPKALLLFRSLALFKDVFKVWFGEISLFSSCSFFFLTLQNFCLVCHSFLSAVFTIHDGLLMGTSPAPPLWRGQDSCSCGWLCCIFRKDVFRMMEDLTGLVPWLSKPNSVSCLVVIPLLLFSQPTSLSLSLGRCHACWLTPRSGARLVTQICRIKLIRLFFVWHVIEKWLGGFPLVWKSTVDMV